MNHRESNMAAKIGQMLAVCLISGASAAQAQDLSGLKNGSRGLVLKSELRSAAETPPGESRWVLIFGCSKTEELPVKGWDYPPPLDPNDAVYAKRSLSDDLRTTNWFQGWSSIRMFAFDETSAFDGAYPGREGNLFTFKNGEVEVFLSKAQPSARARFKVPSDGWYLGSVKGIKAYCVHSQPRQIFFFEGLDASRVSFRANLPKGMIRPLGIANGDPLGDFAIFGVFRREGMIKKIPNEIHWVVLRRSDIKLENGVKGSVR